MNTSLIIIHSNNSRSILKLLSGSTACPGMGLLLKPRNVPSDFKTNHRALQFLMYSPKKNRKIVLFANVDMYKDYHAT